MLFEAGNAFLAGDATVVAPLIGTDTSIYLPTIRLGCFACNVVGGKPCDQSHGYIFARAGTFITEAMRGPDQHLLPPAPDVRLSVGIALWRWAEHGDLLGEQLLGVSSVTPKRVPFAFRCSESSDRAA